MYVTIAMCGCMVFEVDIVMTVESEESYKQFQITTSSDTAAIVKVEVEVDGPYRLRMRKNSFCARRRCNVEGFVKDGCLESANDIEKLLRVEIRNSLISIPSIS